MKKSLIFVYESGDSLYINLTNRCSNACDFCVRTLKEDYYAEGNLWLEREPEAEEVLSAFDAFDISEKTPYHSIVFCGFGEPTERVDTLIAVAKGLRKRTALPIRLNTNGQGNLIAGRNILPELAGLLDEISISLNAPTAKAYQKLCHSRYGEAAFDAMLDFAAQAKDYIPAVILSVVDESISPKEIEICRALAQKAGVKLRVRELIH